MEAELTGTEYRWTGWSDGEARTHPITASGPATFKAEYTAEEPTSGESEQEPDEGEASLAGQPPIFPTPNIGQTGNAPFTRAALKRHPAKRSHRRSARFAFVAGPGARFRCKLDRRRSRSCASPVILRHLPRGKHVFKVVAFYPSVRMRATVFHWRVLRPSSRRRHPHHRKHGGGA
jgi:hypothetical protein